MKQTTLDWFFSGFYANERLRKRFNVCVREKNGCILTNRERYRDTYITIMRTSEKSFRVIYIAHSRGNQPSRVAIGSYSTAEKLLEFLEKSI